jgi:hypothetical protein
MLGRSKGQREQTLTTTYEEPNALPIAGRSLVNLIGFGAVVIFGGLQLINSKGLGA